MLWEGLGRWFVYACVHKEYIDAICLQGPATPKLDAVDYERDTLRERMSPSGKTRNTVLETERKSLWIKKCPVKTSTHSIPNSTLNKRDLVDRSLSMVQNP